MSINIFLKTNSRVFYHRSQKELFQEKQSRVSNVAENSYSLVLKTRNLLETMRVASVEW